MTIIKMTEQTMKDDLKACPMCRSNAAMIEITDEDNDNFGAKFIECTNGVCGITTQMVFNCIGGADERLSDMWNTRAAEPVSDDALREAVETIKNADWTEPLDYVGIPVQTLINHALKGQKMAEVSVGALASGFYGCLLHAESNTDRSARLELYVRQSFPNGIKIIDGGEQELTKTTKEL